MASVGDVIRVRGCQTLLGETLCNVFYYVVAVWTGNLDLDDFLDEFRATVLWDIANKQCNDLTWTDINADNLNDPDEFVERPITQPGLVEGDVMPAYIAFGCQLVRTTKQTRHGGKRIAGMAANNWTDGVFAPLTATTDAIEDALEASIDIDPGGGNVILAHPVIVKTGLLGQPDPSVTNLVKQAIVRRDTTQNSRKGYTA